MKSPMVADKQLFFQSVESSPWGTVDAMDKKDFSFLTRHRTSLEHEFNQLYATLNTKGDNRQTSWLYCYYTASLLKKYYDSYSPACADAIKYSELCDVIRQRLNNEAAVLPEKASLLDTFASDIACLTHIPFSTDKLRDLSGKTNIQRLSTRFSMITVKQSLLLANQYHYLDTLEMMMGKQVNIAILDAPLGIYNALSVGVFGMRFVLNLSMMLKHTFIPAPGETSLTMGERLYEEIKNRHYQMTNDLVWGTVNGLSNYAAYFHIAAPVANYLMIGFTVFDVIWLNYALYKIDQDYALKKQEYLDFKASLPEDSPLHQIEDEKLALLALTHEKNRSEMVFCIAAASILLASFTAVFLLSPPALVPVCFLVCNLAIAMYLSSGQYGEYREKCMIAKQQRPDVTTDAMKNVQKSWDNLGFTMAKNTLAPLVIIGAFTLNLPAALLLTLAYVSYECGYMTRLPELFAGSKEPVENNTPILSM